MRWLLDLNAPLPYFLVVMLDRVRRTLSWRVQPGTYSGPAAALLPLDLGLSLLAKRAYPLYKVWHSYGAWTKRFFDRAPVPHLVGTDAELLDEIRRVGFARCASPFAPEEIAECRAFVLEGYERARAYDRAQDPTGSNPHPTWSEGGIGYEINRPEGRTRLYFTDEFLIRLEAPRVLREFGDMPRFAALTGAYHGVGTILAKMPYYMAEVVDPAPKLESWHLDCVRPTVKVMLALDEITSERAPLRYMPESHKVDEARHRLFYRICRSGLGVAYYEPADCERFDRECEAVTAPAGGCIVFDNRGIHAGSLCQQGQRVLLVNGYRPIGTGRLNPRVFRDPEPIAYPWERVSNPSKT